MTILGKSKIIEYMEKEDLAERLVVTPLLEGSQIGPGSIDIRVGNDFVIARKGHLSSIDPARRKQSLKQYQYHHHVNVRERFVLHPHQLVLASSLEYLRLPISLAANVTSRSRWGRAGLVIATATAIHPGFSGTITLEMVNLGEVPLIIYPGLRVAQLVISESSGEGEYEGRYTGQTDPNFATVDGNDTEVVDYWLPHNEQLDEDGDTVG